MLRFACMPTADLTLQQLREALMNFVMAKKRNEGFVVRMEDANQKKNTQGKDAEIVATLELFGITYNDVLYQSKSFKFHSAMALDLLHRKKAFNCFCKEEDLVAKKQSAKEQKRLYTYDGTCEQLPAEIVIDNPNPFRVRVKKPSEEICFDDKVQGGNCFTPDEIDSFVILNVDKTPTQEFAEAVDDMLSDISLVIQSEERIESAARAIYIRSLLGYTKEVEYAHLPPLLDADMEIKTLLAEGFLPQAIANYLLVIGSDMQEKVFTLEAAKEHFDLAKVSKEAVRFDKTQLRRFNQEHLKLLDPKELSRYVGFADAEIGALAKLYIDEITTTKELKERIRLVFEKKEFSQELQESVERVKGIVAKAPYFEEYGAFLEHLHDQSKISKEELEKILSLFLNTQERGHKIEHLYGCLKNYIKEVVA